GSLSLNNRNSLANIAFHIGDVDIIGTWRKSGKFEIAVFIAARLIPRNAHCCGTLSGENTQRDHHVRQSRSVFGHNASRDLSRLRNRGQRDKKRGYENNEEENAESAEIMEHA